MCKKIIKILSVSVIFIFLAIPNCVNAKDYSLNDLIENGKAMDKKTIVVKGEAIGEALERGNYTWININDTTNAMGVYMNSEDSNKVDIFGSHSKRGDELEVKGVFNRACSEHGGDMDIHANTVVVTKSGEVIKENIPTNKFVAAGTLSVVTLVCGYILYKVMNKKN